MNINTSNPVSFAGSFSSQKMPADKFTKAQSDKILKFEGKAYDYDTGPILGLGYEGFTYKPTIWQKIKDTITFYSILLRM